MRNVAVGAAVAVALGGGAVAAIASAGDGSETRAQNASQRYEVTVRNLTAGSSQPLSPPLVVVHGRQADVWSRGQLASHVVADIAEDANTAPAVMALRGARGVRSATTGIDAGASAPAPIPPGASQTYTVRTRGPADRLSLVSMLVNTNDAFTGLDSYRLRPGTRVLRKRAYDAGSEVNNQRRDSIPGPCCNSPNVRDAEGRVIRSHPGIRNGAGQLTRARFGWSGPVAEITVRQL